ncbi:variable surface protein [Plasmodium gonderi]|uniref:Variable surface protein n=1 Tax=Plasmodium gonderi TaxID=77519 RepID=A0A1Y1JNV3_PLAGO|nr:variable surface protein [Plasmodium gonderi]GAW83940.1 variable surface protein [Plasmodium gonderi]
MAKTTEEELEAANVLKLDKIHEELYSLNETSKFDAYCEKLNIDNEQYSKSKILCTKLMYVLEQIAVNGRKPENTKRCGYLRYWLYEEIGKIYTDHSKMVSEISLAKDLIDIVNNVIKKELKYICTSFPEPEKNVTLDEWKKRKISYMYFQNYDEIKKISNSNDNDKCSKYLTFVNNFSRLYERYKKDHCNNGSWWLFNTDTHYFYCASKFDPKKLISELEACKLYKPRDINALDAQQPPSDTGPIIKPEKDQQLTKNRVVEPKGETNATSNDSVSHGVTVGVTRASQEADSQDIRAKVTARPLNTEGREDPLGFEISRETEAHVGLLDKRDSKVSSSLQDILHGVIPKGMQHQGGQKVSPKSGIIEDKIDQGKSWKNYQRINPTHYYLPGSTEPGKSSNKKEKKKGEFENNYNDEYKEELSRYMSEEFLTHSQKSALYLSY